MIHKDMWRGSLIENPSGGIAAMGIHSSTQ